MNTILKKLLPAAFFVGFLAFGAYSVAAAGFPTAQTNITTGITQSAVTLQAIVTPNGAATTYRFDYGTSQFSLGNSTGYLTAGSDFNALAVGTQISGLQPAATYYYKVVATNSYGTNEGSVLSFTTPSANAPTLIIEPSNVTVAIGQAAQLVARYDADGTTGGSGAQDVSQGASWTSFNTALATHQGSGRFYGQGNGIVTVSASYNGLTTYAMIGVGTSSGGGGTSGTTQTQTATNISANSATLQGSVQPNNYLTNAYFEYGTTQSLGQTTPSQTLTGNFTQNVSAYLSGLAQNTTYYFRVVAQNSQGISQGQIISFVTSGGGGGYGVPIVATQSAANIYQNAATLQGFVNPNNSVATTWFEYGQSQSLGQSTQNQSLGAGNASVNTSAYITGIYQNTTYYYRAAAQNSYGSSYGNILTFTTGSGGGTGGLIPSATTNEAANISANSATLQGFVASGDSNANAWFEYGLTSGLGYTTASQNVSVNYGQNVSTLATNLLANTTYYFRVVVQNSYGTARGATLTFTTGGGSTGGLVPTISTGEAAGISGTRATLSASVNPQGALTIVWFDYGRSESLGASFGYQSVGSLFGDRYSSAVLTGLMPATTYYYRANAFSSYGNARGVVRSFRTIGTSPPPAPPSPPKPAVDFRPLTLAAGAIPVEPKAGEVFDYSLAYENPNSVAAKNVLLTVILPANADFFSSTASGSSRVSGSGFVLPLGVLKPNAAGTVTLHLAVKNGTPAGEAIQSISVLNWTKPNGEPDSASATLALRAGGEAAPEEAEAPAGPSLAARIMDGFRNLSLPFWLVVGLLILIVFYFVYGYFSAKRKTENISEF